MSAFLDAYLTPSASAVKFAIKATLAMFLALYLALWLDLDRPYWALISAAFLQIRPMSGMVVEKGLCQIGGTAIGAVAGIAIMALFVQARVPALIALTAWIMLCTYGSSLLRNNFSYGCIMAAVTAMLIVVIAGSNPASVFDVAVARLSELGLGAICATLVSSLLWPSRVSDHLAAQADNVVNQAFVQAAQRLEASDDEAAELEDEGIDFIRLPGRRQRRDHALWMLAEGFVGAEPHQSGFAVCDPQPAFDPGEVERIDDPAQGGQPCRTVQQGIAGPAPLETQELQGAVGLPHLEQGNQGIARVPHMHDQRHALGSQERDVLRQRRGMGQEHGKLKLSESCGG